MELLTALGSPNIGGVNWILACEYLSGGLLLLIQASVQQYNNNKDPAHIFASRHTPETLFVIATTATISYHFLLSISLFPFPQLLGLLLSGGLTTACSYALESRDFFSLGKKREKKRKENKRKGEGWCCRPVFGLVELTAACGGAPRFSRRLSISPVGAAGGEE